MLSLAVAFTQEFDQQLEGSNVVSTWHFPQILYKHLLFPLIFVRNKPCVISGAFCL